MKRIRLLLVDDQSMFREALRTLLELQADFEIVGEALNGDDAVKKAAALEPSVILMDLRMPGLDGVEATRRVMSLDIGARVIVLTTFETEEEIFRALQAGAVGYLLKTSPSERLCEAIRRTQHGEAILEPSVTAKVITEFARRGPMEAEHTTTGAEALLSRKQLRVLRRSRSGGRHGEKSPQQHLRKTGSSRPNPGRAPRPGARS